MDESLRQIVGMVAVAMIVALAGRSIRAFHEREIAVDRCAEQRVEMARQ